MLCAVQAELEAERLNAACDALAEAAIQRHREDSAAASATAAAEGGKQEQHAEADTSGPGSVGSVPEVVEQESTQQLVERAQAAEQVRHGCQQRSAVDGNSVACIRSLACRGWASSLARVFCSNMVEDCGMAGYCAARLGRQGHACMQLHAAPASLEPSKAGEPA
jgi:hypothetical protein